jgi:transcriptional regulator with XRE-family HTH domain
LAERLGVEPVTISRFETGARGPDLAMLLQLARLLEVPPAALLEGLDVHPQLAREPEDTTYEVLQVWSRIPASFHAVALDVLRAFIR